MSMIIRKCLLPFPLTTVIITSLFWFWVVAFANDKKVLDNNNNHEKEESDLKLDFTKRENIEMYLKMTGQQHLAAVNSIMKYDKYEKKYRMLKKIFESLFEVMADTLKFIEESGYEQGLSDLLPANQTQIMENFLKTVSGCAYFANIILKLPNISRRILKDRNDWEDSYKKCIDFSLKSSNLLDDRTIKLFNLVQQQLNLIERDPDFINPYEENSKKTTTNVKKPLEKKKLIIKKGPKMSKAEL